MSITLSQQKLLENIKWGRYAVRPYPFFVWSFVLKSYHTYEKCLGTKFDYLMMFDASFEKIYYRQESKAKQMRAFIRQRLDNLSFWEKFVESGNKELDRVFSEFNRFAAKDYSKASEKTLLKEFKKFYFNNVYWIGVLSSLNLVVPALTDALQNKAVLPMLKKLGRETELNQLMGLFSQSPKESFYLEEEAELLQLAAKKDLAEFEALFECHFRKWNKMAFGSAHKLLAREPFLDRIKHVENPEKQLKEMNERRIQTEKEIKEWVKLLGFAEKEKTWLKLIRALLYQKTREDYLLSIYEFVFMKFFKEIAKRKNISLDQAQRLTVDETIAVFEGKTIDVAELNERRKAALIIQFKEEQLVLSGKEAEKLHKKIIKDVAPKKFSGVLEGQTGYPGLVKGKARLIHHITHLEQLNEDEILVTAATNPAFVISMKRAAAIVTDEGGITCHAAIISRELKKPCVVGTKYAMQFLKTGDLLEVDAANGKVKKLNK